MRVRKPLIFFGIIAAVLFGFFALGFLAGDTARAQVSVGLPSNFAGFSSQDIKETISNIVQIVLGFLGIVFLLLILYAGLLWMTSQGEEDKINRAKKIIAASVIGLLITLSSYAIARFIVTSLQDATTSGPPGPAEWCGDGIVNGGEACEPPGVGLCNGSCQFSVPGVATCMQAANEPADPNVVKICGISGGQFPASAITIVGWHFGATQAGSKVYFEDPGGVRTEAQIISCGPGGGVWDDRRIRVRIPESLAPPVDPTQYIVVIERDADNNGAPEDDCKAAPNMPGSLPPDFDCQSLDVSNGSAPSIYCINPDHGVYGASITVTGKNFGPVADVLELQGDAARVNATASVTSWQPEEIQFAIPNTAISGGVTVTVGAQTSNAEYVRVDCAPACSTTTPGGPVITSVSPNDGAQGNLITVRGRNFGAAPGELTLIDSAASSFVNPQPSVAACVASWWSDRQIIFEIPEAPTAAADDLATLQVRNTATGLLSNIWTGFDINDTVRPGLCSVAPPTGEFNTHITLTGKNLDDTTAPPSEKIFFGNPADNLRALNETNFTATQAEGDVPNLEPAETTVEAEVDGELSNPLYFTVAPQGSIPIIQSVTPGVGPSGTYVTIQGGGFGPTQGQVWFSLGAVDTPADFDFPPICSTNYWARDHVVVKVPLLPPFGPLANGAYQIKLRTADGIDAQPAAAGVNIFTVNNALLLSPGLCSVNPTGAPPGGPTAIDYFGENFGAAVGSVWFDVNEQNTSPLIWNNQQALGATVPNLAVTGFTTVRSSGGVTSNPLPFTVGTCENDTQCGGGSVCCTGLCRPAGLGCSGVLPEAWNSWVFTAGEYPFDLARAFQCGEDTQSPTPFPFEQYDDSLMPVELQLSPAPYAYSDSDARTNAPIDSLIAARFTRRIDFFSILGPDGISSSLDDNVRIIECHSGPVWGGGCGAPASDITNRGIFSPLGSKGFRWVPAAGFDFNVATWYEVRLNNLIKDVDGNTYDGSEFLGPLGLPESFAWHFRTRDSIDSRCEVSNIIISPGTTVAPVNGVSDTLTANPTSAQCYLCGESYTYNWSCGATNDTPATPEHARFEPDLPPGADGNYCTGDALDSPTGDTVQFRGRTITVIGAPVVVDATALNTPSGPISSAVDAQMSVEFVPPRVTRFSPTNDCRAACINAAPYAQFNVSLNPVQAMIDAEVNLYRCADQNCFSAGLVLVPTTKAFASVRNPDDRVDITPAAILQSNVWYRVVVGGGITNTQGQALVNLNFDAVAGAPNPDSFSWKFQTSLEACTPDAINLIPDSVTVQNLGATARFNATATDTEGACGEVNLNPNNYNWDWSHNALYTALAPAPLLLTDPQKTATAAAAPLPVGTPTNITVQLNGTALVDNSQMFIYDNRDPIIFIGHRPDSPPGSTPFYGIPPTDALCELASTAAQCTQNCTNILASAIFSAGVDKNSITSSVPGGATAVYSFNDGTAKNSGSLGSSFDGVLNEDAFITPAATAHPVLGRAAKFDGVMGPAAYPGVSPFLTSGVHPIVSDAVYVNDFDGSLAPPSALTVSTWVKPEALQTSRGIVSKRWGSWGIIQTDGVDASRVWMRVYMANSNVWAAGGPTNVVVLISPAGVLNIGTWTHVALVADPNRPLGGQPGSIMMYINGTLVDQAGYNGTLCSPRSPGHHVDCDGQDPLLIGQQWSTPSVFSGEVDEVRLYERALGTAEVQGLYVTGLSVASRKFNVIEVGSGISVPGSIAVRNYTDDGNGRCSLNYAVACTVNADCQPANGACLTKRGRVDFVPDLSKADTQSSMTAYYSFNDGTAHDSAGTNDGALVNGVGYTSSNGTVPALAGFMSFDGVDDYIQVTDDNTLDMGMGDYSVAGWIKVDPLTSGTNRGIIYKRAHTGGPLTGYAVGLEFTNAALRNHLWAAISDGSPRALLHSNGIFADGDWHHFSITFDRSGVMTLYRDGIKDNSINISTNHSDSPVSNGMDLFLGTEISNYVNSTSFTTNGTLPGLLDDIRLYNRALSAGEAWALYRKSRGQSTPKGVFAPNTDYEVQVCQNNSCTAAPIESSAGVPYTIPQRWQFRSGEGLCKISFVDIHPNPALFADRYDECVLTAPLCAPAAGSKTIIAQARDAYGNDLGGINYEWRETNDMGGTFASGFYSLDQPIANDSNSAARHQAILGTDYNQVTARSSDVALDLGVVSAIGQMDFLFCQNPWQGAVGPAAPYYLDSDYNFKLSYCRDIPGADLSDPNAILPNLPAPHLIRNSPGGAAGGSDLLKEHVFVVGTNISGNQNLPEGSPVFTAGPEPDDVLTKVYEMGDFVYFKLTAEDPEGDSFLYKMVNEAGDLLPASATFNERTGVFSWAVDQQPIDGNQYDVTFRLEPGGAVFAPAFPIKIKPHTGPGTPPDRPTVLFLAWPAGNTVAYGATGSFTAAVTSLGAGATSIRSFVWDFQDSGPTTYSPAPPPYTADHVFLQSGVHQVTFRVQNDLGVWSLPAAVNITVLPRTSAAQQSTQLAAREHSSPWYARLFSLFVPAARGQTPLDPTNVIAESIGPVGNVDVKLTWVNNGNYESVKIYRPFPLPSLPTVTLPTPPGGSPVSEYVDTTTVAGTEYTYRVCGVIGAAEYCTEITTTARNIDYDVIVARVYKNINHLSIREWYETFAPNPTGSPRDIMVDGYPAIQDGSSAYIGYANCSAPADSCTGSIYTNVLLLSFNPNANDKTKEIFGQLIATLRLNDQLIINHQGTGTATTVWTCSQDSSVACNDELDEVCKVKSAGVCKSPRAELRRDFERVVELHDIAARLYGYANTHKFCADGSNTLSCRTDADCPRDNLGNPIRCASTYPNLSAGSFVGGLSTSRWPSWQDTLGRDLASTLPEDPVNAFGENWYSIPPTSCAAFEGHDIATCWNERDQKFRCHDDSLVYMYQNQGGVDFQLLGQIEAENWGPRWRDIDVSKVTINAGNAICKDSLAVAAVCGNGVIEAGETCDGGSTLYCRSIRNVPRANGEFTVGCNPTTCRWADPYDGADNITGTGDDDPAWASVCGGSCGNNIVESIEECDGTSIPGGYRCTSGGNLFCSNICQRDCTAGVPYQGTCGNGAVEPPEACDDGANNGQPGRCNNACSGYDSFCGDGSLSPFNQTSLGCKCDNTVTPASCPAGYNAVQRAACTPAPACGGGSAAHQYTCVRNLEECDTINGLTTYSCPNGTTLYCDPACHRACTSVRINASSQRTVIPIYETYKAQGEKEDYDYTVSKLFDEGYSGKGIAYYLDPVPAAGVCPAGTQALNNYQINTAGQFDRRLRLLAAPAGWSAIPHIGTLACAYVTDQDTCQAGRRGMCSNNPSCPGGTACDTDADCGTGKCIIGGISVWVYQFSVSRTLSDGTPYTEYYYSRNPVPRIDVTGKNYANTGFGFFSWLSPFQETCGNDVVEGNETCEPDVYESPTPEKSSSSKQYSCGEVFTPNQCRTYGGYCGDGGTNQPFEECDEGKRCQTNGALCTTNANCPAGDTCGGGGWCADPNELCTTTADCPAGYTCESGFCSQHAQVCVSDLDCTAGLPGVRNVCVGNGAACDNSGLNCTQCTANCAKQLVARNYCGDGIVNCGLDRNCTINSPSDGSEEVCDSGTENNGQPGACNESCSGQTGAVCGNLEIERVCSNNTALTCGRCSNAPATSCTRHSQCPPGGSCNADSAVCGAGGSCGGEACDDGGFNGQWAQTCSITSSQTCDNDADCPGGETCTGAPVAYCSFSCLGPTWAVCGDGFVQNGSVGPDGLPGTGDEVDETCDSGSLNGRPGQCNSLCNGFTTAVCGDSSVSIGVCTDGSQCGDTFGPCLDGSACVNGEMCDPPQAPTSQACTTAGGDAGLRQVGCANNCQENLETQCLEFGLSIYSDAVDVAYFNGSDLGSSEFGVGGLVDHDPVTTQARDIALDGGSIFVAGSVTGNAAWRVEKRSASTGALDPAFDGDGIAAVAGPYIADELFVDASGLYVGGRMNVGADCGGSSNIRIEKRNPVTGALDPAFDGDGVIAELGQANWVSGIVADATHLYISGNNYSCVHNGWRLEKRNKTTGALDTGFGGGDGMVGATNGDSNYYDNVWPLGTNDLAIDTDGYLYIVGEGWGEGPVGPHGDWRIEKRRATDGALCDNVILCEGIDFNLDGEIRMAVETNRAYSIAVDGNSLYVVGEGDAASLLIYKFDKRTGLPDGVFNGGSGNIESLLWVFGKVVRVEGSYIYIAGQGGDGKNYIVRYDKVTGIQDNTWGTPQFVGGAVWNSPTSNFEINSTNIFVAGTGGGGDWRTEKRNTPTGALVAGAGGAATSNLALFYDSSLPLVCSADPALNGASYATVGSPPTGNACASPATSVPYAPYASYTPAATVMRPVDAAGNSMVNSWEIAGKNVIAVKVWPEAAAAACGGAGGGGCRSFQAAYVSPTYNEVFVSKPGASSEWACTNVYTAGWNLPYCPGQCIHPTSFVTGGACTTNADCAGGMVCDSYCSPNPLGSHATNPAWSWRRPFTYTGAAASPLCNTNYTNFIGGEAKWIWGPDCSNAASAVYCRLEYGVF